MHCVGLLAGVAAVAWLLTATPVGVPRIGASALIYGVGLLGMLAASAAYNLAPHLPAKRWLRRLDHAMIYVMIGGSYTPFTLNAMNRVEGAALCAAEWVLALIGIVLALTVTGRRGARLSLALYLGMGWLIVLVVGPLATALPTAILINLLVGGLIYTAGAIVQARGRMLFHNALWHVMVLVAAGFQFSAVAAVLRSTPA